MAQQFLFPYDHNSSQGKQVLPYVFNEHFNTETEYIYVTGNDRIRYKVELKKSRGQFYLADDEWNAFVAANVPEKTKTIHFILQGVHDYYVTVYDDEGAECAGYERRTVGPRFVRCLAEYTPGMMLLPGDFLQDIWHNNFTIRCDNLTFNVLHERVRPFEDKPIRMNGLTGDGWAEFAMTVGVEVGQRLVFTNLLNYNISVVVIGGDGVGLNREDIRYTMMRRFGQRKLIYDDEKDKRMQQFCTWPHHADHVDEDHVFYTPLCAYVTDAFKLTIQAEFCNAHPDMHTYTKAYVRHHDVTFSMRVEMIYHASNPLKTNHVVMKGLWRDFGKTCGFVEPKMMRMKLVATVNENIHGAQIQVPVFHVC